ncbi:MAG TPA: DUF1667 domain-containing protein [Spirochaetales bacterium]|nr:DUF1667 domain-containing protein [Spirochaetales bacterium]
MPETLNLTCIMCPRGCRLTVVKDGDAVSVSGHACPRGEAYGRQEAVCPLRSLTTTVRADGGARPRLAVRSSADLPLSRLLDAMAALDGVVVRAPVRAGDVVARDILGLGVDMLATDNLEEARHE